VIRAPFDVFHVFATDALPLFLSWGIRADVLDVHDGEDNLMEQLEDRIELLREFDRWRSKAARLRDEGCKTLLKSLEKPKQQEDKTADQSGAAGAGPADATSGASSDETVAEHSEAPAAPVGQAPAASALKAGGDRLADTGDPNPEEAWPELDQDQVLERAEILKALLACRARDDEKHAKHVRELTDSLEYIKIKVALCDEPDHVPVVRAAKALCALAAAPDSAFSGSVMYFMYVIVREIFLPRRPDWVVGGAGAGDGLSPNGFVTWQCVRAVSDFQSALRQTAELIQEIAVLVKSSERFRTVYESGKEPEKTSSQRTVQSEWESVDEARMALSFKTTVNLLRANIALRLKSLDALETGNAETVEKFIAGIRKDLIDDLKQHRGRFSRAFRALKTFRRTEESLHSSDPRKRRQVRIKVRETMSPHLIAHQTVWDAGQCAKRAAECFTETPNLEELDKLATEFLNAADSFDALLKTVHAHVSRALDTQLAAATLPSKAFEWDPGEMAFAAAAYVETAEVDSRVRRAAQHLLDIMGESGVFPLGNPVRTTQHQYTLHAHNAEIIRAVAAVLEKAHDVPFTPGHAERMLAYFYDGSALEGRIEGTDGSESRSRRVIAAAVLALARVNRMLDERINQDVFRFFSVKRPEDIRSIPPMRELFYPDYGLTYISRPGVASIAEEGGAGAAVESSVAEAGAGPAKELHSVAHGERGNQLNDEEESAETTSLKKKGVYRKDSIAVVLERMRAHVRHVPQPKGTEPTFSLVLHGPPGTGKTTLVESLAKTCGVPLVEVTPSDIVIGGAEKMEARARAVFAALSLLTRCVILFDEFDPVILKRSPDETNPSVFSFLTPGMLPKLKTLHERAEKRSVAYVLVTNLIAKLDEAAIRQGRFDLLMGIYPPDVLSRFGRLTQIAFAHADASNQSKSRPALDRIWKVVYASGGGAMTTLGKPGWFSPPKEGEDPKPKTALAYLFNPAGETLLDIPKEARLNLPALPPKPKTKLTAHEQKSADVGEPQESPSNAAHKWWRNTSDQREDHATREFKEWAWVVGWDAKCPQDLQLGEADGAGQDALERILAKIPPPTELNLCFRDALSELLNQNEEHGASSGDRHHPGIPLRRDPRGDGLTGV
jgi:hypothetical protein